MAESPRGGGDGETLVKRSCTVQVFPSHSHVRLEGMNSPLVLSLLPSRTIFFRALSYAIMGLSKGGGRFTAEGSFGWRIVQVMPFHSHVSLNGISLGKVFVPPPNKTHTPRSLS